MSKTNVFFLPKCRICVEIKITKKAEGWNLSKYLDNNVTLSTLTLLNLTIYWAVIFGLLDFQLSLFVVKIIRVEKEPFCSI
jgi:hypothetical protein